ncbi:hypothetical protein L6164_032944 [Bauhinia variegata]|uniref:Uncharacterized protein n=1 Tax=Bauhinia variegata TaxID=167791 RepID=A0ACB9KQ82_BAUVA|nr:hypothetical protein L6164_032944 [Bauhinia variegata]
MSFQDVGKSILESYSRVLESMAFNIVARIDDLLYVDDLTKHSDRYSLVPAVSVIAQHKAPHPYSVSVSGTPQKTTAFGTPSPAAAHLISPARGERTPFIINNNNNNMIKPHRRGFGVRRVLSNYLGVDTKAKICSNTTELNCPNPTANKAEKPQCQKEIAAQRKKTTAK